MNPILQKLLSVEDGIGLCWLGNLGWLVRAEGRLIAFDLDLERDTRFPKTCVHGSTDWTRARCSSLKDEDNGRRGSPSFRYRGFSGFDSISDLR